MKHALKFRKFLKTHKQQDVVEAFNDWMEKDKCRNLYLFIFETESMKMVKNYMLPNSKRKAGFSSAQMKPVQTALKKAVAEISEKKKIAPADVKKKDLENSETLADALDDVMQMCGKTLENRFKIFEKSRKK